MIVPFFPPMSGGGVHRPLSFVRGLEKFGWRPTVIAPDGASYWIRDESLVARVPDDVEVLRTRSLSGQSLLSLLRRGKRPGGGAPRRSARRYRVLRRAASAVLIPDSYVGWYPFAVRAAFRCARSRRFDAVYSTSPPETAHLIGLRVSRRYALPWVADFRDPWMNLHLLDPPGSLQLALHRRLEASVVRDAHVVVTTHWHEHTLRDAYPGARISRVSNGYDAEAVDRAQGDPARGEGPLRIVHTGMLTQNRTVRPLLAALRGLIDAGGVGPDDVRVVLAGPREDSNDAAVREFGLGDIVEFRESLSHDQALALQKSAHVLLLIKHDDVRYRGLVPGKIYEYLGARRPVLALVPPGEARDLIVDNARGVVADPSSVDEVSRALRTVVNQWREGTLGTSYDLGPRDRYARENLVGGLAEVLDAVCRGAS